MHALVLPFLLLAAPAAPAAPERLAVLAVHDPPAPDGELTELTHQLRAAAVERLAGVLSVPEMRDRLAGKSGGATVQELDRAFGGALAVYQNGELDSAARTLRAIIADLEELPEGEAVWTQWTRAMMRLSHVHLSLQQPEERDAVQVALLKVDSSHQLDPVLYAPGFRAHFEELRQKVRALPKRRLTVTARGRAGTIYVSGRDVGPTPATVILPPGTYRVAGAAGALRIPSFSVDLGAEDRAVVLDFALAETFRPGAGPGMLLQGAERGPAIIRAGAWLGVEKLVVASRGSEGGAQFLVGAIYDVRRGALLREGSVRMISGGVPAANLGALASFLLTGQSSREVQDRTREPQAARGAPRQGPLPQVAQPAPAPAAPAPQVTFIPAVKAGQGKAGGSTVSATSTAGSSVQLPLPGGERGVGTPTSTSTSTSSAGAGAGVQLPLPSGERAGERGPARTPARTVAAPAVASSPPPEPAAPPADLRPAPPPEDPLARALAAPPPVEPERRTPPRWAKPAAIGAAVLGVALTGLAVQQGLAARSAYREADGMVLPGGLLRAPYTAADHGAALRRGDAANRNAWLAAGGALAAAAAGGGAWWLARE